MMKSVALVMVLGGVAAAQPTAAQVLATMESHYQQAGQLTTGFIQTVTNQYQSKPQVSKGMLYASRPSKFRADYATPTNQSFIYDGATLWIVNRPNMTVTQIPSGGGALPGALMFLDSSNSLALAFSLALGANNSLELTPKKPSVQYSKIVYVVDASGEVSEATVFAPGGNSDDFVFKNQSTTAQINPNWFTFNPQASQLKNYKIIHAPAPAPPAAAPAAPAPAHP